MKNNHKKEDIAELGVFSIRINSDKIEKATPLLTLQRQAF
jgi:hypothetical protein